MRVAAARGRPARAMNAITFGMVLTGVLLNAGAQLLLKAGTNAFPALGLDRERLIASGFRIATEPHIVGGLACYVLSVAIWIAALSRVPVSVAYPMLSIGYIVNALAAWMLFGESLSAQKLVGIGVIMVGVYLVARS
jgi:multidrug transporter EmrE-like cation transporter